MSDKIYISNIIVIMLCYIALQDKLSVIFIITITFSEVIYIVIQKLTKSKLI